MRRGLETLVVPFDAGEVTRVSPSEAEPGAAAMTREDVDAIWRSVVAAYETGLYPALALCVRRRGHVVIDRSIGHLQGNEPGAPRDAYRVVATPATMFNLFSASKMVTAMLVHLCDQRGLLHLDDPVAHYIPEFGAHGKHRITIRHVLTHRAGIPHIPPDLADPSLLERPSDILDLLCAQKPTWAPGRRLAYHALTGGYVLAAVIERVTGAPIRTLLKEVRDALGMSGFDYGVPAARMHEVAQNAFTGPPVVPPLAQVIRRALSVDFHDAVRISNDPRFLQAVIPAGNIMATANEASRFMQLLLDGGAPVFEERTIRRAVAETSYLEVDLTLGAPVRYSMGFMLGARWASVYGMHTPRTFGHLGFTNVVVYADPDRELAVALMTSGKPALSPGLVRWLWIMQTIARVTARAR
ncbi:MAG TPA: serine hydrolase domain-containing protein [Kofleriaceae bacterium]|nr:serine hydrolase domain-containing protein [Kofleriaceae bacterium]